jgi:hypothetical protein
MDLSKEYNFDLYFIPTPTKESNRLKVDDLNKAEILGHNFEDKFKFYFDNILYLNDSSFMDNTHLNQPPLYRKKMNDLLLKAKAD